jgi:hypothetical protein
MNERLVKTSYTLVDPTEGNPIEALEFYYDAIFDETIVAVSVSPQVDDTGATLDIDDDGTNVIAAVDASDQNVPGTWKSTHVGGTNAPVHIAAGSKVSFDINAGANGTAFHVVVWALLGEVSA